MNEDNCVLDERERRLLHDVFGFSTEHVQSMGMPNVIININKLFLKIHKLNELAKEKGK